MHPQALLVSLLAAGAVATPIIERAIVTEYNVVTAVVTVTATPGSYGGGYPHRGHRYHHHKKPKKVSQPSIYQPPYQPLPERTKTPTAYQPEKTKAPKTPSGPPPGGYAAKVIRHHNVHRSNHSVPDVQWDQGLADTAMKIAQTCVYAHNTDMDGGGYGQNIAAGIPADNITAAITDAFYNGEVGWYKAYYGREPTANFEHWGHFSQIVWKGTSHVGCATFDCSATGLSGLTSSNIPPHFTVCNYKNPGNYDGEYAQNVLQPLGRPTVNWSY
jgi:uncharacterized protein YkwD